VDLRRQHRRVHVLNRGHTLRPDIQRMQFQAWACWAIAVVLVSGVLQLAAFFVVSAPVWGTADLLAQGAIWTAVLWFAIGMRPQRSARPSLQPFTHSGLLQTQ
jgi:hypothetical protein